MIQIIYHVVCDNCSKFIEYKRNSHEKFIIDFLKEGWFIENDKHYCSEKCKNIGNEK